MISVPEENLSASQPDPAADVRRHGETERIHRRRIQDAAVVGAILGDAVVFALGLLIAFWFRFDPFLLGRFADALAPDSPSDYLNHFIFGSLVYVALAARYHLYERTSLLRFHAILPRIMKACVAWCGIYLLLSLFFKFNPPISRVYVVIGFFVCFILLMAWRLAFHQIVGNLQIGQALRQRILIVGWNTEVQSLADAIFKEAFHPYHIVGCVPSANNEYRLAPPAAIPRLGDYGALKKAIESRQADIVLVGDLDPSTREIASLAELCDREMVQFKVIPNYFQILVSGLHLQTISGVPVMGVDRLPLDSMINRSLKRTIDLCGALAGLILTAPLIAAFGAIVWFESPGPVIYRQTRLGRMGRPFTIFKIRSMRLNAEQNGAQWCQEDDGRRLRVGAFMRKWNIDETPQFWNVLKGDMSLVGPRPERPELIENFKGSIRHYNARHGIKPGLTGWAQIHGLRGNTDLNERIRYDLYYVENWTPFLDAFIMLLTVFRNKNAY